MAGRHVPSLSNKSLSCVTRSRRCDTCSDSNTDLLSEPKMKTGIIGPDRSGSGRKLLPVFVLEADGAPNHRGIQETLQHCVCFTLHRTPPHHNQTTNTHTRLRTTIRTSARTNTGENIRTNVRTNMRTNVRTNNITLGQTLRQTLGEM